MTKPDETLWELEAHSRAKHEILRSYLSAWLPIMSKWNGRLVLVDGFAGPGRYKGGEDGSPIIMLKAFLEHHHRHLIEAELVYLFIEEDADRAEHLEQEVLQLDPPDQVKWQVVNGRFEEVFREAMDTIDEGRSLAPTFAFIDPFGYTGAPMRLTADLMQFDRCEVLTYVPFPFVNRFLGLPDQVKAMTSLFGTDEWKGALELEGRPRIDFLRELFQRRLAEEGGIEYVRSFEIVTKGGRTGYDLFFATGNEVGLNAMKRAMWSIDPTEGRQFRDATDSGQQVLIEEKPDFASLGQAMRDHFGDDPFTIEDAQSFALVSTPFLPTHIRRAVLVPAEKQEELDVLSDRKKKRTYPPGTRMRFVSGDS